MNIRKVLTISLISFAFFVTGCSSKDIGSVQSIADEATHQRTMTKVQNNVSEIIGKDYKYVLENMGRPYCTTYYIDIDKVKTYLAEGKIVIVAGFQGMNKQGEITTLGRGGSDTTAVALAAKLACPCHIYTDVEGIYSVDPRLYPPAKKLAVISYEEMMEMASLGAGVMEPRSILIGQKYNVPIYVASSMNQAKGTYIKEYDETMEEKVVTGLSVCDDIVMVTISQIPDVSENIALIFEKLAHRQVNVDMISQAASFEGLVNVSFTAKMEDLFVIKEVMAELNPDYHIDLESEITKLSVVGMGMRNQSGVSGLLFRILSDHQIPFRQVTTSEISISYAINRRDKEKAVRILSQELNL